MKLENIERAQELIEERMGIFRIIVMFDPSLNQSLPLKFVGEHGFVKDVPSELDELLRKESISFYEKRLSEINQELETL